MTHELTRKLDRYTIEHRLKYTHGWTTEELTWQAEKEKRDWERSHDSNKIARAWIAKHLKLECARQEMPKTNLMLYKQALCKEVELTANIHGVIRNGDIVSLRWTKGNKCALLAALPSDLDNEGYFAVPCGATATEDLRNLARSSFHVYRNDTRIPVSVPLMYGECIFICTTGSTGNLFLNSCFKSYERFAGLSENQEVTWSKQLSTNVLWKVLPTETQRSKNGIYIQANDDVILNHVMTNQNLALEENFKISTLFGLEHEVTAHTADLLKSRKNIWQFEAPFDMTMFTKSSHTRHGTRDEPVAVNISRNCYTAEDRKIRRQFETRFQSLLQA